MYDKKVLGLTEAEVAFRAIIGGALKDPDSPVAVAVADDRGDIITLTRMTGASWYYAEMATKKAYTAAKLRRDIRKSLELRKGKTWGMYDALGSGMTMIPGGVAITEPGRTVVYGAIGVSGRSDDEDEALAFIGLKAMQAFLWPPAESEK